VESQTGLKGGTLTALTGLPSPENRRLVCGLPLRALVLGELAPLLFVDDLLAFALHRDQVFAAADGMSQEAPDPGEQSSHAGGVWQLFGVPRHGVFWFLIVMPTLAEALISTTKGDEMHDEIQALRQALEDGGLEYDLALEVADRNLGELDDAVLVLAVGSLIVSARDQAAGAVERCLELAELAIARSFERSPPTRSRRPACSRSSRIRGRRASRATPSPNGRRRA
jgi:hypothetical protein